MTGCCAMVDALYPADPRSLLTGAGFAMTYKLFVRLTTGNESGSEAVTVTRPL